MLIIFIYKYYSNLLKPMLGVEFYLPWGLRIEFIFSNMMCFFFFHFPQYILWFLLLLCMISKSRASKKKINLTSSKLKTFAFQRYHQESEKKKKPREWKKIYANYISDKGLVTRTYKELLQHKRKKITQLQI